MWITTRSDGSTVKFNTDFISEFYPDVKTVFLTSGTQLTLSEEDYNELESSMFPTRKKVAKENTELAALLNELHRLTGGKSDVIASPQRLKKLGDLLKVTGMDTDKLTTAAYYIGKDAFLQGENDNNKRYGDIDYLLSKRKDGTLTAIKWAEYKPETKQKKMF
jgi:hypothetical protein